MRMFRRAFILALAAGVSVAAAPLAQAQANYPTKPIKIIAPVDGWKITDSTSRMNSAGIAIRPSTSRIMIASTTPPR